METRAGMAPSPRWGTLYICYSHIDSTQNALKNLIALAFVISRFRQELMMYDLLLT